MSSLFLNVLNLAINASWLILAVIVARLLLKKAPKWANCLLWGLVAIRLVCPFSFESALSLLPSGKVVPDNIALEQRPHIDSGLRIIDNTVNPVIGSTFSPNINDSVNPMQVVLFAAGVVWAVGMLVMLSYALVSYILLKRKVRASLVVGGRVFECDEVRTPFILGIIRPIIYVPSGMDEKTLELVTAHEEAHITRRDHWWKPLGFALLAVYWFNPLLWLAYTLLCRDIELACDERVLRGMDAGQIKDYSSALLACSVPRRMLAACPLAFGEVGVGARVKNALRYKKPAFWIVAASVIVCIVVAVCFLTNPERATMKWAKSLRVEDVARIELFVMPQAIDKQYKDLDTEEIAEAVARINKSRGWYVRSAEPLTGGSTALYVTTTDGVRHTVVNNGLILIPV